MSIARTTLTALAAFSIMLLLIGCGSDKKATLRVDLTDVQAGSFLLFEISDYDTGEKIEEFSLDNPGATEQSHTLEVSAHDMPAVVEVSNVLGDMIIQYGKAVTTIDGVPVMLDDGETIVVSMALVVPTVDR